jgi:hypothetical protein
LLLTFSLAPGLVKVTGDQTFFAIGYLCLATLIAFSSRPTIRDLVSAPKLIAIGIIIYGLILTTINSLLFDINESSIVIGVVVFILPILLSVLCNSFVAIVLLNMLPWIGLVHAIIALLIYPYLPFSSLFGDLFTPLQEGVMAFRLASVSGSLAFSSLMATSFAVCIIRRHKESELKNIFTAVAIILSLCLILSLQRSMWLITIPFIIYALSFGYITIKSVIIVSLSLVIAMFFALSQFGDLLSTFTDLAGDRMLSITSKTDDSPVGERLNQWLGAFANIQELPLGAGIGQLGQANRDGPFPSGLLSIPDGDYFRIVSEYGPYGLILIILIIAQILFSLKILSKRNSLWSEHAFAVVLLILFFQGVGSNMTELYFVNFLFFVILLNIRKLRNLQRLPTRK